MPEKPAPHFRLNTPGRTVDKVTPQKPARTDNGHDPRHSQGEKPYLDPLKIPQGDEVYSPAQELGNRHLGGVYDKKTQKPAEVLPAVSAQIRKYSPENRKGYFLHLTLLFEEFPAAS
jgi:hypothetical protein